MGAPNLNSKNTLLSFLGFLLGCVLAAQQKKVDTLPRALSELGHPLIQNYTPDDYGAFTQNWDAVRDELGRMYFGNGDGVLIYNGAEWHLIPMPNNSIVFSLDVDTEGVVYVGAQNELGFMRPDQKGDLVFESLLQELPEDYQVFDRVNSLHATPQAVYFCTDEFIVQWDGKQAIVVELECSARMKTFWVHKSMYASCVGKGLMKLIDGEFKGVNKGHLFVDDQVNVMLAYDDERALVCTKDQIYLFDGQNFTEFQTNNPNFFKENTLYKGAELQNGSFALASLNKGILIIDRYGIRQAVISEKSGLLSNQVLGIYQDHTGLLWASLFSGISKVEYPSPYTYYQESEKFPKLVYEIMRFGNELYVGGPDGLFVLEPFTMDTNAELKSVGSEVDMVWSLLPMETRILASGIGIYEIDLKSRQLGKVKDLLSPIMYRSKLDPNRVFVGLSPGLTSIYLRKNEWVQEKSYEEVDFEVAKMKEDAKGNLWLGTYNSQLSKLSFTNKGTEDGLGNPVFKTYDTNEGFPEETGYPVIIEGKVHFVTATGRIYTHDVKQDKFLLDSLFYKRLGFNQENVVLNSTDEKGNLWVLEKEGDDVVGQFYVKKVKAGTYSITEIAAKRIKELRREALFAELNDSTLWYRGKSSIIRHDIRNSARPSAVTPNALISRVLIMGDSLAYGGFGGNTPAPIEYRQNQIRFQFASPSFYDEKANLFQYQLSGFDREWSNWTLETQKDYTNIPEGDYTFKVRVRNIFGEISKEAHYKFTILPPWFRSRWAYLIYVILGGLLLWVFGQWRSMQLRRKNLALETIIGERTEEIQKKNQLLEYQTERLKEMDTMKTRLFANISHEFRTPLTLIKGPIEKLESTKENKISTTNIKMIRRNANRLLNLVNQLLDLSKLDSGKLQLNATEGDVFKCLRAAASSFSSHAASRNMDYQIKIPSKSLWTSFDRDKLEKVTYNLLGNALKFTEDEGRVIIEAQFRSGRLYLKVSDTGAGIAPDKLPHIFDRFFQVDDSYTKEKTGSGIGLALTKELVELMGGVIYVESEIDKGTAFKVVLPYEEIKSNHKEESEIATAEALEMDSEPESTVLRASSGIKVLIIEDNNDMRHFIKEQLIEQFNILEARNGSEGLEKAKMKAPDLIITDLMMPQMDGVTLCKHLKTDLATSHIPVIMLTAKAGIEDKLEGLETGADDYLTKPFNAAELLIRVKNLIEQRQKLRDLFSRNISLDPKEISVGSLDEKFLRELLALLEEQHSNSAFGVPQMQKALGMSKTAFHTKVKALTNHPPGELLRKFRLKRAAQLLSQNADNISQIAYDVGFNSLSYFTRCFKELYRVPPSEFKGRP